jgi:quercetin dioxygenase-like cupin family protein
MKLYKDTVIDDNSFYRIFSRYDTEEMDEEFIWHRDRRDREIYVVAGYGWKLQMENKMPQKLKEGDTINISQMEYHRLINEDAETGLILKIVEK